MSLCEAMLEVNLNELKAFYTIYQCPENHQDYYILNQENTLAKTITNADNAINFNNAIAMFIAKTIANLAESGSVIHVKILTSEFKYLLKKVTCLGPINEQILQRTLITALKQESKTVELSENQATTLISLKNKNWEPLVKQCHGALNTSSEHATSPSKHINKEIKLENEPKPPTQQKSTSGRKKKAIKSFQEVFKPEKVFDGLTFDQRFSLAKKIIGQLIWGTVDHAIDQYQYNFMLLTGKIVMVFPELAIPAGSRIKIEHPEDVDEFEATVNQALAVAIHSHLSDIHYILQCANICIANQAKPFELKFVAKYEEGEL